MIPTISGILHKSPPPALHAKLVSTGSMVGPARFRCARCERLLQEQEFALVGGDGQRMLFHPNCHRCRGQVRHELAGQIEPLVHGFLDQLFAKARASARKRRILWAIEPEDLLERFVKQQGLCALSGTKLHTVLGKGAACAKLDRIDPAGGFTVDNVHLVCAAIAAMKGDLDLESFGGWCIRVVTYALHEHAAAS